MVVEPALGCRVRGIEPPCPYCASGRHALCLNVAKGDISPGIQTGFCHDTGGGWSRGTLVAHPSQLHRVPDAVPDEAAVAVEPLACAVHAALEAAPGPGDTSLVIGAGSVGLFTVAALRHLTEAGRIICVAKHDRQRKEALRLGADVVVHPKETYTAVPKMLGTEAYKPELGKPVVTGGADRVYECVGSPGTMEDAVRLTKPGGEATLVGMPGAKSSLDLTALWYKEIRLSGSYAYGAEEHEGERTSSFALALRLAPEIGLEKMVGPRFRLEEYGKAVAAARSAGREGNVKVVFDHRGRSACQVKSRDAARGMIGHELTERQVPADKIRSLRDGHKSLDSLTAESLTAIATEGSDDEQTRFCYLSGEEQPPDDVQRGGRFSLREAAGGDACDLPSRAPRAAR